jgi:hypothetical protein
VTRRLRLAASALFVLATGCAMNSPGPDEKPARLSFAIVGTVQGFPGSFRTLDGRPIDGTPTTIELPPGHHTVGYWCPNHLVMDGPPTVSATFEADRIYVLHCQGNDPGRVEQR